MRLPNSLAVRLGSVAVAAAIAVSGGVAAAGAASAAPAHTKVPTALSITNTTPRAVRHHTVAVVKGQLTGPDSSTIAGKRVFLQRQGPKGHWYVTQIKRTRRNGWVRFAVRIGKHTVNFRLVFRGTRNFARSRSAVDSIAPAAS